MTITYPDGTILEAMALAHQQNELRVAVAGEGDVRTLRRLRGTWISEEFEPVRVEFAWERVEAAKVPDELDCLCPASLASRLISMVLADAGEDEDESLEDTVCVLPGDRQRARINPSSLVPEGPTLPARPSSLIGQQLNSYRVLSFLAAGGMGEVFRAHDTILGREVAIKILPSALACDPERLDRLRREARVLASLNHPNIATIYGLEEYRGTHFLVLELVEGETLATYIANKRGTIRETFHICSQIAEALGEAHKKAIVHRDIKPENIKLTPEGRVKVLDFGLAKAFSPESSAHDRIGKALVETEGGRLVGTPPYMSPEHVRGNVVDARSDLWAFGCLAYEMLTRKRAFTGSCAAETFAAILGQEPDWKWIPAETPPEIVGLLQRCLQKDARFRPVDAGTACRALQKAASSSTAPRRFPWRQASLAATLLLAGILTAVGFGASDPVPAGTRDQYLKHGRMARHRRCVWARKQASPRIRSLS